VFRVARSSLGLAYVLFLATAFAAPLQVAAECTSLDPWPSFREAARTAETVLIGQVVESLQDDSADNSVWFRFRVDEVLRGQADAEIEIKFLVSGAPIKHCDESILRVRLNDRIGFALNARIGGVEGLVTTVAWLRDGFAPTPTPAPDSEEEQLESLRDFLMPSVERLAVSEVRALAALPATDTADPAAQEPLSSPLPFVVVLLVAGVVASTILVSFRERRIHSRG
jgi:hypothetical protein